MRIKAFIYHKRTEKYNDCQDCFGINTQNNRIAVSDGMSQSIFPQWWAQILVDAFIEQGTIPDDISELQQKWQHKLDDEIQRREDEARTDPKRNPWRLYNAKAERSGAGATLCGLTRNESEWICECIGDSCLIGINNDYTLNFYTSQVGEFSNHPDYLDSFMDGRGKKIKKTIPQDVKALLMVSDPFSELFQKNENDVEFVKSRFEELQALTDHNAYTQLVEKWRDDFGMHNDDSTLILMEDCATPSISVLHKDDLLSLCKEENLSVGDMKTTTTQNKGIETQESKDAELSIKEAEENFIRAASDLSRVYTGKKSKIKFVAYITKLLRPITDIFKKS